MKKGAPSGAPFFFRRSPGMRAVDCLRSRAFIGSDYSRLVSLLQQSGADFFEEFSWLS